VDLRDKVVVVTGGGNGIGAALCRRFAGEGARAVVVADLDGDAAAAGAGEIGGAPIVTDVSHEADVRQLVERAEEAHGPIDLFCANAGVGTMAGVDADDEVWRHTWDVNVMAHVYAARALLPGWAARGEGYLLTTASAAGLLTQLGGAPYAVTKHAAVAFAEWVAIHYGDAGVKVSCLCPQGVRTNMLAAAGPAGEALLGANALEPDVVAETVVAGLRDERFLILPHPEVADYERRRADDRDRWLGGMRKLLRRITSAG
jgi:NAD(P)-dependent dehydrogenase (short-subunit alcohol dehydrogenase family)